MRIAVISDVHCSGRSCPRQREFIDWIDQLSVDSLWMLGDIFHYGWDFRGRSQPEYQPVFEAIDRLCDRGVGIRFVVGNHDFAMTDFIERRWRSHVHGPQICVVDGRRVYVGHGDEFDLSFGYRLTKWLIRSAMFKFLILSLGSRLGTHLLATLAGREPNMSPSAWPVAQARLCAQLDRADIAIVGHLHHAWEYRTVNGVATVLGPGVEGSRMIIDGELC